jgi:hypothetical protein
MSVLYDVLCSVLHYIICNNILKYKIQYTVQYIPKTAKAQPTNVCKPSSFFASSIHSPLTHNKSAFVQSSILALVHKV